MIFNTIEFIETGKLAVLKLNRPQKKNAINSEMISDLRRLFTYLKTDSEVVMLQVVGKGDSFCAGADIEWLNKLGELSPEESKNQILQLAEMLELYYSIPQVTVTLVHGSVYGGGLGLLACSDFVISSPDTVFAFSEIKLGLVPATISPFVIRRIGSNHARQLFFSGERFNETKAFQIGLVDQVAKGDPGVLNYETLVESLLKQPHHALLAMKKLFRMNEEMNTTKLKEDQTALLASLLHEPDTKKLFERFLTKE